MASLSNIFKSNTIPNVIMVFNYFSYLIIFFKTMQQKHWNCQVYQNFCMTKAPNICLVFCPIDLSIIINLEGKVMKVQGTKDSFIISVQHSLFNLDIRVQLLGRLSSSLLNNENEILCNLTFPNSNKNPTKLSMNFLSPTTHENISWISIYH